MKLFNVDDDSITTRPSRPIFLFSERSIYYQILQCNVDEDASAMTLSLPILLQPRLNVMRFDNADDNGSVFTHHYRSTLSNLTTLNLPFNSINNDTMALAPSLKSLNMNVVREMDDNGEAAQYWPLLISNAVIIVEFK